jgi:hypothetical protein
MLTCAFFCSFFLARRIWFLVIFGAILTAEGCKPVDLGTIVSGSCRM